MVEVSSNKEMLAVADHHQRSERTGAALYRHLSGRYHDSGTRDLLLRLAEEEDRHAEIWKYYCGRWVDMNQPRYLFLILLGYLLGKRFLLRRMKSDETETAADYRILLSDFPELEEVYPQEEAHEAELLRLLNAG